MVIRAQSEARVASRFLRARGWDDPEKLTSDYRKALTQFDEVVEVERSKGKPNDLILGPYGFIPTAIAGRKVAEWALQTRKIPPGKEKFLELASRALLATRRIPRNIIVWYDKNKSWLQFLLEATTWPDREESGEEAQAVVAGKFKVHNTIGADEKHFSEILSLVESASRILSNTQDFKKVLYGDVYVVGQISKASTLAWYSLGEDDVYIRSMAQRGFDDLQTLCHELGHRYWYKFTQPSVRQAFARLYYQMRSPSNVAILMPEVGDVFPVPLSNKKGPPPTIIKEDALRYHLSGGGFVPRNSVRKILEAIEIHKKFPTKYSAKDVYEFFAELFAFYSLGKLAPELASGFEKALRS